jgi:iron(II)-dependent oxidoreductase
MTHAPGVNVGFRRFIPGGSFTRGSSMSPDEQPVQEIELSPFYLDEYPVTNARFAEFIEDGGYRQAHLWTPAGWAWVRQEEITEPNYWQDPLWSDPEVPVTGVSWWEALAYARWAEATLPTETQWEYACKGRSGNTYPWGEQEPDLTLANFAPDCDPVDRRPTPPDRFARNVSEFGVRDLAGNFAEWCLDNYALGYQEAGRDPVHVTREEDNHVVRGGCGLHDADYLRCSARDHYHPSLRDNLIGFRCAIPAAEEGP